MSPCVVCVDLNPISIVASLGDFVARKASVHPIITGALTLGTAAWALKVVGSLARQCFSALQNMRKGRTGDDPGLCVREKSRFQKLRYALTEHRKAAIIVTVVAIGTIGALGYFLRKRA